MSKRESNSATVNMISCFASGGLGVALDRKNHPSIGAMLDRLKACPGMEYAAISWHRHLCNAVSRQGEETVPWLTK